MNNKLTNLASTSTQTPRPDDEHFNLASTENFGRTAVKNESKNSNFIDSMDTNQIQESPHAITASFVAK